MNKSEPLAICQSGYGANENLERHCKLECLAEAKHFCAVYEVYKKVSVTL